MNCRTESLDQNFNVEKENPIKEAQRYVDNARQTLKDNGEYDSTLRRYSDRKSVKSVPNL